MPNNNSKYVWLYVYNSKTAEYVAYDAGEVDNPSQFMLFAHDIPEEISQERLEFVNLVIVSPHQDQDYQIRMYLYASYWLAGAWDPAHGLVLN